MDMNGVKGFIIGIILVSLIAAAGAIALDAFQDDQRGGCAGYVGASPNESGCGYAYNITGNGLTGVLNTSDYFDTAGTIVGVALLLGIVLGAFYFMRR